MMDGDLSLPHLRARYLAGDLRVRELIGALTAAIDARGEDPIWISRVAPEALEARARALEAQGPRDLPLFGIPFAVKDNIDAAGLPTTAACPAFVCRPTQSAPVVERLLAAGAVLIGKTNLDQFATGLTGTRSPYGLCRNLFDPEIIAGGSSSGSALAVATGLISFALGTDTAGSGRVPAALGNIVGLKPTRGLLSTRGVVPACRSLDCVSVFALTCDDALAVARQAAGFDAEDPFSRREADHQDLRPAPTPSHFRFGVPERLDFCCDEAAGIQFTQTLERLCALGGEAVCFDDAPFREAARLLYDGPWLAERKLAFGEIAARAPEAMHPDLLALLARAETFSATDAFAAHHRLQELRRAAETLLRDLDCVVTPSIPTAFPIAAALADPKRINTLLGTYTNHVNLLDLSAVAVPAGFLPSGIPFGISLIGPRFAESRLCAIGDALHRACRVPMGATSLALPEKAPPPPSGAGWMCLCVAGAHMSGLGLNRELRELGARFLGQTRTAPLYRLYLIEDVTPPRPGLVRAAAGTAIEAELWEMPLAAFGAFIATIPPPLGIGTLTLEDGSQVKGFLCEAHAAATARDISGFGGWRAYLAVQAVAEDESGSVGYGS